MYDTMKKVFAYLRDFTNENNIMNKMRGLHSRGNVWMALKEKETVNCVTSDFVPITVFISAFKSTCRGGNTGFEVIDNGEPYAFLLGKRLSCSRFAKNYRKSLPNYIRLMCWTSSCLYIALAVLLFL